MRAAPTDAVGRLCRAAAAADALVLSFPVWNYGYPAILKGFFDRVFLPGVSFRLVDGKVQPSLHNIRKVAAVTTYGGSRFRALLMGDPPRKLVNRLLRATIKPGASGLLSGPLFDEPVDRRNAGGLHDEGGGQDGRVLMRALVVYCHPVPESFCAAIRDGGHRGAEGEGLRGAAARPLRGEIRPGHGLRRAARLQRSCARRPGARSRISSI